MGRHLAVTVVLCVTVSCSGGSGDPPREQGDRSDPPAGSTPDAEPASGLVDLDELEDAGIRATRVEPDLGRDRELEVVAGGVDVAVAGDVLVSRGTSLLDPNVGDVMVSTDRGATWRPVELPGAPRALESRFVDQVGEWVLVTAGMATGDTGTDTWYIWASRDGTTWRGGHVTLSPGGIDLGQDKGQLLDGRLAVPVITSGGSTRDEMVVSSDGGASWQQVGCPAESIPSGISFACFGLTAGGRGLWLRNHEVSVDEGRTWHAVTITPDPGVTAVPRIRAAVALEGRGWLGVADLLLPGNVPRSVVVRSSDGVTWEAVTPDPCADADVDEAQSSFSPPVPLGDRFLVAGTCSHVTAARRSQLHLLDGDGTHLDLLAGLDTPGLSFGQPAVSGTTVVVPEIHDEEERLNTAVTFLQLEP